eukprot:GGOE01012248.1.p1 GENE.GGOE01012248.1~~GGOE01012248.1.p1  ORF type:complete len:1251 (-),score=392.50 GGOE01012248.1:548-3904(-)
MAQAMGAEKLYDAYHESFADCSAPLDKLCELFEAGGLTASQEQVEAAIAELWPEASTAGSISYKQCEELFLHLQQKRQKAENQDQELLKASRFTRWLAGLSDKDSTNLLLLVVVTLCCISAFLAGGLAILLLAIDDTNNVKTHLQENLGIVQDTLEVYASQIAVQEGNERSTMFVSTMASILQNVAYATTVSANTAQLSRVMLSVGNVMSAWYNSQPQQEFAGLAFLAAQLTNTSLSRYGLNDTASILNEMNGELPDGNELLLGQWGANSTAAVDFLTRFRYASECANNSCVVDGNTSAPMKMALSGITSASWAMDYRASPVYAGYSSVNGLGVQLNILNNSLYIPRYYLENAQLNAWSADSSNSWEFMIGFFLDGQRVMGSALAGCDAACAQQLVADGMPLARALNGETGTTTYTNFRGVKSVVTYAPVPNTPMGLAIHMSFSDITRIALDGATNLVNNLNQNFPSGSEEFELVRFKIQGNTTNFTHLTAYKYATQCPSGGCLLATKYLKQAVANCSTGVMLTTDYRGTAVLVGYACISEVSAVLTFKTDLADMDAETLAATVEAINDRNAKDTGISSEFLVAKPKSGLTAAQVTGYGDFDVVSNLKHPELCVNPNCTYNRESALRALQNLKDVIRTTNYYQDNVLAAPSRSTAISYGIGLAVEEDRTDSFQSMVDTIIKVACFTAGMVVCSTVVLIAMTKLFLKSMIKAKEEGHNAVEQEKERFSKLVSSMYPKFVVPQLLEGEKQLVCEVPGAAVFFSDIHEFTSASNTMGSEELLQLMGYVYGVMDFIADRFGVYKVKTIGDAYLAVRGLPGSDSENPSLEMLRFASFVCQVFGDRFVHPIEGQVLALMNNAMHWNGGGVTKQKGKKGKGNAKDADGAESVAPSVKAPSIKAPSMAPSKASSKKSRLSGKSMSVAEAPRGEDKVQCIMSYGLAVGKIVAGVLAGRCPMFDIWGGTVNLASRMQSTGEPGRIQVSEHLYHRVIADEGQPFSFEAPRKVYCKGFGNVNAYMVRTTIEGLPKDIQSELGLEPRYGAFHFDNLLSKLSGPEASASEAPKPTPPSESQKPTPTSPNLSAHPERTVSIVLTPSNGKQRAPIVNEQRRVSGRTGNSPKAVN